MVTGSGYIKRMPLVEFEQQRRGTRGKAGARMAEDDLLMHFLACNDHDRVLFISEKGVAFAVRAFQVPLGSRTAKGVPLPQVRAYMARLRTHTHTRHVTHTKLTLCEEGVGGVVCLWPFLPTCMRVSLLRPDTRTPPPLLQVLPLSSDDTVSSVIPMTEPIKTDEYLVLLTTKGYIKKTRMEAFAKPLSNRGLIAITLEEGDALRWARRCVDGEDIIISTRLGYSMRFASADLRASGRQTRGVRAIKLRPGDEMVDIAVLGTQKGEGRKYLLAVTTNGYGKRIPASAFKQRGRGGMGVIAIKFKAGLGDSLACMRGCADNDEVGGESPRRRLQGSRRA
jgi:DNA gyrase subunit A